MAVSPLESVAGKMEYEVAVIGAGLGDFVILERADDIGGTWRDNTYPGIAVDVPAQAYQFSFELNPGWSRVFAEGSKVKTAPNSDHERLGRVPTDARHLEDVS